MTKIIASIIFTIALLFSQVQSENPKQKCILETLIKSLNFTEEHFQQISNHIKITDFNDDSEVNRENLLEKLELVDSSTYSDLQYLLTSQDLSYLIEPAIHACGLNVSRTKRRCEREHGEGNCIALTPFVYGKKCDYGYSQEGVGFCLPNCPLGFKDVQVDPFVCEKSGRIQRSKDLVEEDLRSKYSYFRNVKYLACPDGYKNWGVDYCVQKCPLGFTELGMYCQKPLVKRRNFELYIYDVSVDDFLNIETIDFQY